MEPFPDEGAADQFSIPHRLCEKCQNVADTFSAYGEQVASQANRTPQVIFDHYDRLSSLFKSAREGCHLCSIFVGIRYPRSGRLAVEDAKGDSKVRVSTRCSMGDFDSSRCAYFDATIHCGEERLWGASVHRHLKKAPRSTIFTDCEGALEREARWPEETRYGLSVTTGSRAGHDLLDKWLKRCLAEHDLCSTGSPVSFRPTRLLDLNASGNDRDICVVPGERTSGCYATLSYCWGGISPLSLQLSNYEEFHKRISWISFPQTMQDAITVCRRLSVRYLWIDALCIVQGKGGDFQDEAARMQAVYSGGIFTIAAADSKNPHGGLFRGRSSLQYSDCHINEDDEQIIFVRGNNPCGKRGSENCNTPDRCVLGERGWVFQERMLSPRTLYFGRDDIHWECREGGLICQSKPKAQKEAPWGAHDDLALKSIYLRLMKLNPEDFSDSLERFQRLWRTILQFYCNTRLSHEEDRLSAIAGIVSAPQKNLGLQASFGLWLAFLLDELCWFVNTRRDEEVTLSRFDNVPTWSWLHVSNFRLRYMKHIPYRSTWKKTLYTAKVTTDPIPTPFVQIPKLLEYSNDLKLKGRCVRCCTDKIENNTWTLFPVPEELNKNSSSKDEEQESLNDLTNETITDLYTHRSRGGQRCYFYPDTPGTMIAARFLHCLLLKRETRNDRFGLMHVWDFCLVLEQSKKGRSFKRVGVYCECISALDFKDLGAQILQLLKRNYDPDMLERLENGLLMFPRSGPDMEVTIC
jgi:hypothetical protein